MIADVAGIQFMMCDSFVVVCIRYLCNEMEIDLLWLWMVARLIVMQGKPLDSASLTLRGFDNCCTSVGVIIGPTSAATNASCFLRYAILE